MIICLNVLWLNILSYVGALNVSFYMDLWPRTPDMSTPSLPLVNGTGRVVKDGSNVNPPLVSWLDTITGYLRRVSLHSETPVPLSLGRTKEQTKKTVSHTRNPEDKSNRLDALPSPDGLVLTWIRIIDTKIFSILLFLIVLLNFINSVIVTIKRYEISIKSVKNSVFKPY